jgi:hypothetical protein
LPPRSRFLQASFTTRAATKVIHTSSAAVKEEWTQNDARGGKKEDEKSGGKKNQR